MKKPEMIIFDYWQTLCSEPNFDLPRGYRAAFEYISENPDNITAEELYSASEGLLKEFEQCRKLGFEVHQQRALSCAFERFGLSFSIPINELEQVLWDNTSAGAIMPHAAEMLSYLDKQGIRTGVISNLNWSGEALSRRLNRLLPENKFEFIIASSEYVLRKPDKRLFEIALQKAKLPAERVWYCGDSIKYDVYGAHGADIQPVHYESGVPDARPEDGGEEKADFDYLHIHDWLELIEILENATVSC